MDSESKKLLEETLRLVEENNKMLRKVRNVQKWALFWRSAKILVIVGITLGLFYFLEPYINKVNDIYNSISATQQKLNTTTGKVNDILDVPNTLLKNLKIE